MNYLNCSFAYLAGNAEDPEPLPQEVLDYHDELRTAFQDFATKAGLNMGIENVDIYFDGNDEFFVEFQWFDVSDAEELDSLAVQVQTAVQNVGIRRDYEFHIQKHVVHSEEVRTVYQRKVKRTGNSRWKQLSEEEWRGD